ncbi:MAG: hypothetical protein ACE37K_12835 [Planctomycetota bacterium]
MSPGRIISNLGNPFAAMLALLGMAAGQSALDADQTRFPPGPPLASNGTHVPVITTQTRNARFITSDTTWAAGRVHRVENPGGNRCDLVIDAGADLRLKGARVEVRGDVYIREGGSLHLEDCEFLVYNSFNREFSIYFEGGRLDSERSIIGGRLDAQGRGQLCNIYLNNGVWTARDTTYVNTGGILVGLLADDGNGGITGFRGEPNLTGGELIADGLFGGANSDAVHVSGWGDVTMRNSTSSISLYLYDNGVSTVDLDLDNQQRIVHDVYGDPALHDATFRAPINHPVPGAPWRLELENHLAPDWRLRILEVRDSNGGNLRRFRLANAGQVVIGIGGLGLTQAPVLVGPWRNYFPLPRPLPALPTVRPPGENAIPPGCGVRIGNVLIEAPTSSPATLRDWIHVISWAFNLDENSDLTIQGNMRIAEVILQDSQLSLSSGNGFDAEMVASSFNVLTGLQYPGFPTTADLRISDAIIGETGLQPQINSFGLGTVLLERVLARSLNLRTGPQKFGPQPPPNNAQILARELWDDGATTSNTTAGGSITIMRPTTAQNYDFQNADFEAPVSAGVPHYWAGANVAGSSSTSVRGQSDGVTSYRLRGTAANGHIEKQIALPQGTLVGFRGWIRGVNIPAGAAIQCQVRGSAGGSTSVGPTIVAGQWRMFMTPPYEVTAADQHVVLRIGYVGAPGNGGGLEVLVDDLDMEVLNWWDADNFVNLDFDATDHHPFGTFANQVSEEWGPAYWFNFGASAYLERNPQVLRSGAAPGSAAARIDMPASGVTQLNKQWTFLEPGQTLTLSGWVRGIPATAGNDFFINMFVGQGGQALNPNNPATLFWQHNTAAGTGWVPFSETYTVPGAPDFADFTKLAFTITSGAPGDSLLVDDITITIQ